MRGVRSGLLGGCGGGLSGVEKQSFGSTFGKLRSQNFRERFLVFQIKGFRRPFGPASHLSLLAQRKVTERKGTPMERPPGILPFGCASVGWGLLTAPPCAGSKRARVVRAPLRADPPNRRRSIGAPVSGHRGRQSRSDSGHLMRGAWTFGVFQSQSFRRPFGPTSHLSLLAQRKVTQRKGTPMERPPGLLPFGCASVGWGLLTAPPCAGSKRARVVRAPLRADPPDRRRSIGAPVSGLPGRQSQSVATRGICFCFCFCGHDGRPMGPLGRGETATDSPKGRAHDARVFFASIWARRTRRSTASPRRAPEPWMAQAGLCCEAGCPTAKGCRKTPATARAPGGQDARKARPRGAFSLGYLSLGKQRKVTRRPEGPAKALDLKNQKAPTTTPPSTNRPTRPEKMRITA
jgi:hypothetical protein